MQNKQSWRLFYQQSKFYFQRFFFPNANRSRPSSCQDAKLYFTPFWKRGGQDQSNSRREQVWRWLGSAAGLTWIWDGCTLEPTHDLNTIKQHIKNGHKWNLKRTHKLVEVVTVVDVDAEDNVGNSLLQIWDVICVWTCDMTSRGYFGKMNSTLGSVVPLAMFWNTSLTDKARHEL